MDLCLKMYFLMYIQSWNAAYHTIPASNFREKILNWILLTKTNSSFAKLAEGPRAHVHDILTATGHIWNDYSWSENVIANNWWLFRSFFHIDHHFGQWHHCSETDHWIFMMFAGPQRMNYNVFGEPMKFPFRQQRTLMHNDYQILIERFT